MTPHNWQCITQYDSLYVGRKLMFKLMFKTAEFNRHGKVGKKSIIYGNEGEEFELPY
jgi:hypothetical protein